MTTEEAVRRWIDGWLRGWRALDPEPIVAVYADDCFFLSHPFREPQTPREYVEWAFAEEEWAEPWFGEPLVDGDRAAVEWRAYVRENGTRRHARGHVAAALPRGRASASSSAMRGRSRTAASSAARIDVSICAFCSLPE